MAWILQNKQKYPDLDCGTLDKTSCCVKMCWKKCVGSCRLEVWNFMKKETPVQMFSCKFCNIFKGTFFVEHISMSVSEKREQKKLLWVIVWGNAMLI